MFSQTVEGLLRAVGPLKPTEKARIREIGFDPDAPIDAAYPVEKYVQLQRVAVEVFAPDLPFPLAIESLGRRFVDGYGETLIGRAVIVGMKLLGPKRTLQRLTRTLSTGSTFFETKLDETEPGVWRLWINRVTYPGWYLGLLRRGLELAGARDIQLKIIEHVGPGLGLTLEVRWS